jgi:hypothetical protein
MVGDIHVRRAESFLSGRRIAGYLDKNADLVRTRIQSLSNLVIDRFSRQ